MAKPKDKKTCAEPDDGKKFRKKINREAKKDKKAMVKKTKNKVIICGGQEVDRKICRECGLTTECKLVLAGASLGPQGQSAGRK